MKIVQVIGYFIALASLAVALAAYFDAQQQSKMSATFAVKILATMQQIASKAEQEVNVYYIAERTVELKEKPNHKAKSLITLERNYEVRLIERKHKWIFVEYDSGDGFIYGWVDKKYLTRK